MIRAGAVLVLLLSGAAIYGLAQTIAFTFERVDLHGATLTAPASVDETLADVRRSNLFGLSTRPLVDRLRTLPTVADAAVSVRLPDTLVVSLREREAVLVWQVGERRLLLDAQGNLFARLGDDSAGASATLPVIEDRRTASLGLDIGQHLDPVDVDAATRLASLVPGDVGSEGQELRVSVTDASGFVVGGQPAGWRAVFGFYTPSLRPPEWIPGQVRLLRSLLIGREPLVDRVILASQTAGTYTARPTPTPTVTPPASPEPAT